MVQWLFNQQDILNRYPSAIGVLAVKGNSCSMISAIMSDGRTIYCRKKSCTVWEDLAEGKQVWFNNQRPVKKQPPIPHETVMKILLYLQRHGISKFMSHLDTVQEVKAAYRFFSKILHPDSGGNAQLFDQLNQGYNQALSLFDPEEYDWQSDLAKLNTVFNQV